MIPPVARREDGARVMGMGIVSGAGMDVPSFRDALAGGRTGIRRIERPMSPEPPVRLGAEIEGFAFAPALAAIGGLTDRLATAAIAAGRRSPLTAQTAIVAALQAWCQAGLHLDPPSAERIGLVVAGHNTTQGYQYSVAEAFRRNPEYLSPRYVVQSMDSHLIGVLSEVLGIRGESMLVGGASASGNVGVIQAARLVNAGLVDVCLTVGAMADLSPMEFQAFHNVGAMGGKRFGDRPALACRPFDTGHEGFIYGQAAACLVIESSAGARSRGAPDALARICGGAVRLHGASSTAPDAAGEAEAMRAALRQGGLPPDAVEYLNTHGTSSPLGDRTELQAIEQVFGPHYPRLWLNATKAITGHCLHSAGIVELIACVIQMRDGFLHPNPNLDDPIDARARFCGRTAVHERAGIVLSNSFGFGGINTSILLRSDG